MNMDFARKQLEKYGWSDGKGLGKNENGIAQALKPKLKRSVTGVGHDAAADFTEHWWTQLYNKAAGNVEVEDKNGKTKKIKTKDADEFEITNSTWKLKRKRKKDDNQEKYSDYFVKKAVLANGGRKMENVSSSESDEEGNEKKNVFKMTDEELFAACEGRTAHKGARHGLKATGKLARIAQQEEMLLAQPQFEGYSHWEKLKKAKQLANDHANTEKGKSGVDLSLPESKKQKKKKLRYNNTEYSESKWMCPKGCPKPKDDEKNNTVGVASVDEKNEFSRKSKFLDSKDSDSSKDNEEDTNKAKKKKYKSKTAIIHQVQVIKNDSDYDMSVTMKKAKKKKLKKKDLEN